MNEQTKQEPKDEAPPRVEKVKDLNDNEHIAEDSVKIMEIWKVKLKSGKVVQQLIAQEHLLVEEKPYMVESLLEAIKTIMRAKKREPKGKPLIKTISEGAFNRLKNNVKGGAFGGGKRQ